MKITEIKSLLQGETLTKVASFDKEITSGFVGDLLSVVMGKAQEDCAWVTIQGHINIVAVGSLVGVGCIIVTEGFAVDADALAKADTEDIVILSTGMSSYEACSVLAKAGL